jgi:two-component sensor histidine kinase
MLDLMKEQKQGGYSGICFTYDLLGAIYLHRSNFDKALYYSLETIKAVGTDLDSAYLPNFYNRIASIYYNTNNQKEAMVWVMKGLDYEISTGDILHIYSEISPVIGHFIQMGKPNKGIEFLNEIRRKYPPTSIDAQKYMALSFAKCYAAQNKNSLAEKYFEEAIRLIDIQIRRKELKVDLSADEDLAQFYLNSGQYGKAKKYFEKALSEWPQGAKNVVARYKNWFMFTIDSASGKYLAAIKDLRQFQWLNDSTFKEAKNKQIEELRISYETDQKDQQINLNEQNIQLLTKKSELQKSQLQQAAILRDFTFAGVLLLFIIVALLYNRYRLKRRTNKKLELQQHEISKQNISLQHLVTEKEWLLRELHHRVKNNLQVMMSLQDLQARNLTSEEALKAVTDSSNRLYAMSLIHQKLYQKDGPGQINIRQYISELVRHLAEALTSPGTPVKVKTDLRADFDLDVTQAIPVGLILNEAITNVFKYAFAERPAENDNGGTSTPLLQVSLSGIGPEEIELSIKDNGKGYEAAQDKSQRRSLGFSLMEALAEELDGTLAVVNEGGLAIILRFTPLKRQTTDFSGFS